MNRGYDAYRDGIYAKRYSSAGTLIGTSFQINSPTTSNISDPLLAMSANGDFVAVWQAGSDVWARVFTSTGSSKGLEFVVNAYTTRSQSPECVAMDDSGNFVIVWKGEGAGDSDGIYARKFNSFGIPLTGDVLINDYVSGSQSNAEAVIAPTGEILFTWSSALSGDPDGVALRHFDNNLTSLEPAFRVNSYTTSTQQYPAIAALPTGDFVLTWDSKGQDGDGLGVYMKRYRGSHAPVAGVGNQEVVEGQSVTLNASLSTDMDPGQLLYYYWDLNGDGNYSDAVGVTPTVTWSQLLALGISDGLATASYTVWVVDANGLSSTASGTLTISNAAPNVKGAGALNVPVGAVYSLTLSALDPSPADNAANFTYEIDWDGNGVFDQSVILNGGSVTHVYPDVGEYDILIRVTDGDGGVSAVQKVPVNIYGYMLRPNSLNPLLTDLVWSGTSGNDSVQFEQTGVQQVTLRTLTLNNTATNTQQVIDGVTGQIVGLGQKGNDRLDATLLHDLPTELRGNGGADTVLGGGGSNILCGDSDGGEGGSDSIVGGPIADTIYADGPEGRSDVIHGGGGNDVIFSDPLEGAEGGSDHVFGEAGNDLIDAGIGTDTIDGGSGNDVLVGGAGKDSLSSGLGEDLLISGNLAASFYSNQQQGIKQVAQQWQASDSFSTRVSYLQGAPGGTILPPYTLVPGTAVLNDAAVDSAIADDDTDADWLLVNIDDIVQLTAVDRVN